MAPAFSVSAGFFFIPTAVRAGLKDLEYSDEGDQDSELIVISVPELK
jgi:hypothetical protein